MTGEARCGAHVYAVPFAPERCERPALAINRRCEEHDTTARAHRRLERDALIARRAAEEERLLALLDQLQAEREESGDGDR